MIKEMASQFEEYKKVQNRILELRSKSQEISKKKEYWFEKKEALKKEIIDLISQIKDLKLEMDKKSAEVGELKSNRRKYNSEVKILIRRIKKINSEKEKAFKDYHLKIEPSKILERINQLEKKVEIETSFEKEKKLMEEIKKLKKVYEESAEAFKVVEETRNLDKEIKNSRKKADEFHQQIQQITKDNNYARFLQLSKQITALKKTQEEAFQIFIEQKNEHLKINQELKVQLEEMGKLKVLFEKDKELMKLEQEDRRKDVMKHKAADVEEKIKKKKKLTTEDILAFQSRDE